MKSLQMFSLAMILLFLSGITLAQSGYKVAGTIDLGGEGRWDYLAVDNSMNRLYVTHEKKVEVIDLNTNKFLGQITGLSGIHGVAFAPAFSKGFISDGTANNVTVFDLKSLKVLDRIPIQGDTPDAIVYEPFTKRVFCFNHNGNSGCAIDAATNKIAGTIDFDGNPEYAASDNKGSMFVNIENESIVEKFDPKSLKVLAKWSLSPLKSPTGMAIDIKNSRLFVVGQNQLMAVLDSKSGKIISTLTIGKGVDGCAFDSATNFAFSSNGEGTISVVKEVSPSSFKVVDTVTTQKGARTIALDERTHKLYTISLLTNPDSPETAKSFGVIIVARK